MRKPKKLIQIRKIARIRDKATGDYFEIVEFPVSATERSRLELPPSVVVDPGAFEKRLRDAGAILPKHKTREFLRSVAGRKAPLELVYEAQTGWTENRKLFVLNDGVSENPSNVSLASIKAALPMTQAGACLLREIGNVGDQR